MKISAPPYRNISRHTRMVVASRWFLWLLVGGLVLMLIWVAMGNGSSDGARLVFSSSKPEQIQQQNVMQEPRYQGLDDKNQPYVVEADKAIQQDKDTVLLYNIRADLNQNDGKWLALNAAEGKLLVNDESMYLSEGVELFYDGGYEMKTERAEVDANAGTAFGDAPVEGQSPIGTLEADGFSIKDKGRVIEFNGSVRMKLYP